MNLRNLKNCILTIITTTVFLTSCKKDLQTQQSSNEILGFVENKIPIKLGKKLDNPFTTKNMKIAYENIKANSKKLTNTPSTLAEDLVIETNAYYVRFLADNNIEVDYLEEVEDSLDVYLYDVPFDYEITVSGDYYHDPTIPLDLPTWQYTAVSTEFDLQNFRNRGITYEILDELYLPAGYGLEVYNQSSNVKESANNRIKKSSLIESLVDEAERLTGNEKPSNDLIPTTQANFNPQGRIQVFDTYLNRLIPLKGVKVRARRWFTIIEVTTDANGDYFSATSFSRPANYAIFYESREFDVRTGT